VRELSERRRLGSVEQRPEKVPNAALTTPERVADAICAEE
jgi:hypothetical protein